ncbi:IS3 family transposase [Bacillus cytotoxicus]|uniref:IS3-like element ISBce13 family transposase n=1 Tax=Bacillus cytotoxicus TaxID=580165 RepID=UPI000B96CC3A|nr:IS3-like element ISBce13 family transposase [Bacillus cytotoxicus]AWC28842.1 IS3 family transposase [Bacillus cytotoxicus]AWC39773.1 IS3 family transposase [Bacillus cytotoxicus]AWC47704.1 IS3 family transposase [Bacillus cytotoxicus]AWC52910.1 IS3 family transposase [Bacillus cytotoxicus]AWC57042.1 IS3 family transposase [Bacillus cytotoxicus]
MANKNFNEEFKKMVVELYHSDQSVKELSSEYGVSEVTIYKWIKKYSPITTIDEEEMTPEDLKRMQKEMLRLKEENEIFKKGYGHIREKINDTELHQFIDCQKETHSVRTMCQTLGIARSSYYQSQHKTESKRSRENEELTKQIIQIHQDSGGRYGAPKIHQTLLEQGFQVSVKRVQRLMKKENIRSIILKKYKPHSSKSTIEERINLLEQDFSTTTINEKWVADITYIHTQKDGWCYLASVMDLHSKKIIGYSFSRNMTTNLVVKALENAYHTQRPQKGLILHTDLGTQYTSQEFQTLLANYKIKPSFSKKGCPYNNACIESFHAILKKEEVYRTKYVSFEEANLALFQYIEGFYNRKRIHSSIGYKTPQTIEDLAIKVA